MEIFPIAESTNPEYYYYLRNEIAFDTPEEAAKYIAETWDTTGQENVYAMVRDYVEGETFKDYLYDELVALNKSFSISIAYADNGQDSFFIVIFAPAEE